MKNDYAVISSHHTIHLSTHHSNTNKIVSGPVLSHQDIDLTEDSEDGPIYIFESCTFNNLGNTGDGGAITCSASSNSYWKPQLLITGCSFRSCVSYSGYGGGVYAAGTSSFLVEKTIFTDCNSSSGYAGGVFFTSGNGLPLLSDTSFISCHARMTHNTVTEIDEGGAITICCSFPSEQIHNLIQSCRFISCACFDWGGGGYIVLSYCLFGCTESLFSACEGLVGDGLGIDLIGSSANILISFCFFSCNTRLNSPTDVSINCDTESFTLPCLHSFSTKDPSQSVSTIVNWGTYTSRNWLMK